MRKILKIIRHDQIPLAVGSKMIRWTPGCLGQNTYATAGIPSEWCAHWNNATLRQARGVKGASTGFCDDVREGKRGAKGRK